MMIRKFLVSAFAVFAVAGVTVWAEDIKLDGIKCIVAPKPASADKSADYKEGKVFFCCGNCAGKFAEDSKKFATNANMQLVATKQYEQKSCPLSGGPLNAETAIKVGEAKVSFCCNNCKGKVESTEGKEQLELVYGEKAFEKAGFAKVATKE
jgi:hypothetical protein